jgi:hypothetical protein
MVKEAATMDCPIADSIPSATGQQDLERRNQKLGNCTNIVSGPVRPAGACASNLADFRHLRKLARRVQTCLA